jgi:hypothetical protein
MTDTPGVAGGLARDGGAPSRDAAYVESFSGKVRAVPSAYSSVGTEVECFVPGGGSDSLNVRFGSFDAGCEFSIWTTPEGFEAIIGSMSAALARYRIACDAGPVEVPEEDIPF